MLNPEKKTMLNRKNHLLVIVILLCMTGWNAYAQDIDKSKANKVKAGLLYNMAKMITWPETSFKDTDGISIVFLGEDYNEIGRYFDTQAKSRSLTVNGRKFVVKEIRSTDLNDAVRKELSSCHILFILSSYTGSILDLLHIIGNNPTLVIGESSSFPEEGGMIGLSIEAKHIGISVNLDAINKTELKISAQLLQHATIIYNEE
jgi:hypothetical protein